MPTDDSATQAVLDNLLRAVNARTPEVSRRMAERVRQMARFTIGEPKQVYEHFDGRVDLPGLLFESIMIQGPSRRGRGGWTSRVGPTAVYARQREFGGPIRRRDGTEFLAWINPEIGGVFVDHDIEQEGSHYFRRAWELALPSLDAIAAEVWNRALAEGTA